MVQQTVLGSLQAMYMPHGCSDSFTTGIETSRKQLGAPLGGCTVMLTVPRHAKMALLLTPVPRRVEMKLLLTPSSIKPETLSTSVLSVLALVRRVTHLLNFWVTPRVVRFPVGVLLRVSSDSWMFGVEPTNKGTTKEENFKPTLHMSVTRFAHNYYINY